MILALLLQQNPAWTEGLPPEPPHVAAVRELLKAVKPDDNVFQSNPLRVKLGAEPIVFADAFGFWNEFLPLVYPSLAGRGMEKWLGTLEPRAVDYFRAVDTETRFKKIISAHELRAGDFLVTRYLDEGKILGHIMMVNAIPRRLESTKPLLDGSHQWIVQIVDCTNEPHGESDPRYRKGGKHVGGIAKADFRIYLDDAGRMLGYSWTPSTRSKLVLQADKEVILGRLNLSSE